MVKDSTVVTIVSRVPKKTVQREACLVVINGLNLGKKYNLSSASTIIGRSSKSDIQIDEESVSRNHALILNNEDKVIIRDLQSTNGSYVNDEQVNESSLNDADQIKIGHTIFKFLSSGNIEHAYYEEIYRLTTTDGLTETYNKRYFLEALEREMSRSIRYQRELSLIMMDLDHFKKVNDTYGHLAGDFLLRRVAQRLQSAIRRDDILARYGGEEFALLLPEVPKAGAQVLAEKIRALLESSVFIFHETELRVSISCGVADIAEYVASLSSSLDAFSPPLDPYALVKLADDRLYMAKRAGRNQVVA